MKARTSGSGRTGCEAVQHSDQMHCARCGVQYDVNDQDPPECAPRPTGSNPPPPAARPAPPPGPPAARPRVFMVENRRSWPEDEGWYLHDCTICGQPFEGGKGRLKCRVCDGPTPKQKGRAAMEAIQRMLRT